MRYLRMCGLLWVAMAAVTMMFVAGASATSVTSTTGGITATPTIHAVNSGGHVKLANPIANIECSSTLEGAISSHGSGVTAAGAFSKVEFTGCTNNWHVTTTANGSFFFHWTGGHNGLMGSTGLQVDMTRLGVTCVYETSNTSIGTVTGGSPATFSLSGSLPINGFLSSPLCGTGSAAFSGAYQTTAALYIEK